MAESVDGLFGEIDKARAYDAYAQLREAAPLVGRPTLGGVGTTWYVTRHADVDAVLRDELRFVRSTVLLTRPGPSTSDYHPVLSLVTDNMLNRDGKEHRRLRRAVSAAFSPRVVQAWEHRIQHIADELLARQRDRGRMDLVQDFAFPLPLTVIATMLGIPNQDQHLFREWSATFVQPVNDSPELARFCTQMSAFVDYLRAWLASDDAGGESELIAGLRAPHDCGPPLSESELLSMILLLIVAGHETTVSLLTNGVLALLQNPERLAEVRRSPELMADVIEELLRYDAPLDRSLTRWASRDTELCGERIRQGDRVVVLLGAANRDPAEFERPDELDFHRPRNRHCAFGRGMHYCLGAPLARLEGRIGVAALLENLPDLRLAIEPSELRWRPIPHMRSLVSMPVAWTPQRLAELRPV